MKRKTRLPYLFMYMAALSAVAISLLAVYLVSRQQRVQEIEIKNAWRNRLLTLAGALQTEYRNQCDRVLEDAAVLLKNTDNAKNPLETIKSLSLKHRIIKHPFLITGKQTFLFPLSRSHTSVSMLDTPDPAAQNPVIKKIYRRARMQENQGNYTEAIRLCLQALTLNINAQIKSRVLAAVGRNYLKKKWLFQAEIYYTRALGAAPDPAAGDPDFFLLIKKQLALIARLQEKSDSALKRYIELYEVSLAREPYSSARRYEIFRNEALGYISRYTASETRKTEQKIPDRLNRFLKQRSSIDLSMQWRYFDLEKTESNQLSQNSSEYSQQQEYLIRVRDLYAQDDEKNIFYRHVKDAPFWQELPPDPAKTFRSVFVKGQPVPVFIVRTGEKRFFGFTPSDRYIEYHLLAGLTADYFPEKKLRVRLYSPAPPDPYLLETVKIKTLAHKSRLGIFAGTANYFAGKVRQEMLLNYFLTGFLILFLFGGITLLFFYIHREQQLIRSKNEFLNMAAHTLKTPVTRLGLLAENLSSGWVRNRKEQNFFLRTIESETRRMNDLIENLLDFSRIESGRKTYHKRSMYLADVVRQTVSRYQAFFKTAGFQITMEIAEGLPRQMLDSGSLDMAIAAILQNSIKYSNTEKSIHVRLTEKNRCAVLSIADRGIGIRPEEEEQIFEKFFRSQSPLVKATEGSGLGLFLARHAVAAHHGTIMGESRPGKGTVFSITLPFNRKPETPTKKPKRSAWKKY